MKGQTALMQSARTAPSRESGSTDDWQTPKKFYELLHEEFDFQLDPCAADAKVAKCESYITPDVDGLAVSWEGLRAFVNFPYSKAKAWAKKCVEEAKRPGSIVVVLCAARTDTEWFQLLASNADEVRFIRGRLSFVGPEGKTGAPFPSAVIILDGQPKRRPTMELWEVPAEVRR